MENLDVMVLRTLLVWRQAGQRALLATVVRTWGRRPARRLHHGPVRNGAVVGSVSGGCIEDDLIDRHTRAYAQAAGADRGLAHAIPSGPPTFVKYGVTADEAHRFGCPAAARWSCCWNTRPRPAEFARVGSWSLVSWCNAPCCSPMGGSACKRRRHPAELVVDAAQLTNTFGPEYRMLLIGAGQLAEYLATMALFSGFAVTVCDPAKSLSAAGTCRAQAGKRHARRCGGRLQARPPQLRGSPHARPQAGRSGAAGALASEAFYIGGIGSRRNNEARRARMMEHFGQTEATLQRLRGPIGVYIGSKTPPEIAVSVMAEILAVKTAWPRQGVEVGAPRTSVNCAHRAAGVRRVRAQALITTGPPLAMPRW